MNDRSGELRNSSNFVLREQGFESTFCLAILSNSRWDTQEHQKKKKRHVALDSIVKLPYPQGENSVFLSNSCSATISRKPTLHRIPPSPPPALTSRPKYLIFFPFAGTSRTPSKSSTPTPKPQSHTALPRQRRQASASPEPCPRRRCDKRGRHRADTRWRQRGGRGLVQ